MDKVFSVSEFISEVNALLAFPVAVEGEVSGFGISQGKWVYFSLKDEKDEALAPCFMVAWNLKTPVEDGMRVRVYGSPRVYPKTGKFSISVERLEPVGEGALKRAFDLMKRKLEDEGLFAPERKRPLPAYPERIGLIASRESAACGDFLRILNNRWSGATVHLYHVQVQGQSAVGQIVEAFRYFSSPEAPDVEALVLIRGGGSLEDLQAFNSEEVARAVYASRVPTVVGVGHERDESIADYVADVRASTPSNAAERLLPDRREALARVEYAVGRCRRGFEAAFADAERRIGASVQSIVAAVGRQVGRFDALVALLGSQLGRFEERLIHYKRSVEIVSRSIVSLSPERLISRGYAIVRSGGRLVRAASELSPGADIEVRLGRGSAVAEVKSVNP